MIFILYRLKIGSNPMPAWFYRLLQLPNLVNVSIAGSSANFDYEQLAQSLRSQKLEQYKYEEYDEMIRIQPKLHMLETRVSLGDFEPFTTFFFRALPLASSLLWSVAPTCSLFII